MLLVSCLSVSIKRQKIQIHVTMKVLNTKLILYSAQSTFIFLISALCRQNCTVLKIDRRTQSLGLNSLCTVFLFQPDICIDNLSTHSSVSFQSLHKFKLWRLFYAESKTITKCPRRVLIWVVTGSGSLLTQWRGPSENSKSHQTLLVKLNDEVGKTSATVILPPKRR